MGFYCFGSKNHRCLGYCTCTIPIQLFVSRNFDNLFVRKTKTFVSLSKTINIRTSKMFGINVHPRIYSMMKVFQFMRLWRDEESDTLQFGRSVVQLILLIYYPIAVLLRVYFTDDEDEKRFYLVASIVVFNLTVRLYYILLKKKEIIELTTRIGHGSFERREEFERVNDQTNLFMKFSSAMAVMNFGTNIALIIFKLPIFTVDKQLPLNLYFPFDWKVNNFRFWATYTFVSYEQVLSSTCTLFNFIIWYLMMGLGMKYQTLSGDLTDFRSCNTQRTPKHFKKELMTLIQRHRDLQE